MAEQQPSLDSTKNPSSTTPPTPTSTNLPSHKIRIATDVNSFRDPDYMAPDSAQTPQTPSNDGGVFGYIRRVFTPTLASSPLKASDVAEKLTREMSSSTEKGEITATKSTSALSSTMPRTTSSQSQDAPTSQLKRSQTDVGVSPSPKISLQTPDSVSEETTPVSVQPGPDDSTLTTSLDAKEGEHIRRETDISDVSIPDVIPDVGASQDAPVVEDKSQTTDSVPISTNLITETTNKTTEMPLSEQAPAEDAEFNFPSKKGTGMVITDQNDTVGALETTISQQGASNEVQKKKLDQQEANLAITVPQEVSKEAQDALSLTPVETEVSPEKQEGILEVAKEAQDASKALTVQEETPGEIEDQIKTTENPSTLPSTSAASSIPLGSTGSFKGNPESKSAPKRAQTMAAGEAKKTPSGGQGFFQRFFSKRNLDTPTEEHQTKEEVKEVVSEAPQEQKEEDNNKTPLTEAPPPMDQTTTVQLELPAESTSLQHSEVADSTDQQSGARSPLALTEVFSDPSERPTVDAGGSLKTTDLNKSITDPTEEDFDKIKELWKEQMENKGLPITDQYQKKCAEFGTPIEYLVDFHSFVKNNKHSVTVLETLIIRFGEDHITVQEFVKAIEEDSTKDKEQHPQQEGRGGGIEEQTMEEAEELQISTVVPVDKESEESEVYHQTKDSASIETTSTLDTAQTSTTQKTGESSTPRDSLEPKVENQGKEEATEGVAASPMEKLPESDGGLLSSNKDTTEAPRAQTTAPKSSKSCWFCCVAPEADQ